MVNEYNNLSATFFFFDEFKWNYFFINWTQLTILNVIEPIFQVLEYSYIPLQLFKLYSVECRGNWFDTNSMQFVSAASTSF
jgi:hypothetical protein